MDEYTSGLTYSERTAVLRSQMAHPSARGWADGEGPLGPDCTAEQAAQAYWKVMQRVRERNEELEALEALDAYEIPPVPGLKPEWVPPQMTSWED